MQGAKDLLESERGVFCLTMLVSVTILVILGKLTGPDWLGFAKLLVMALVTSKTLTGAVETWVNPAEQPPKASS